MKLEVERCDGKQHYPLHHDREQTLHIKSSSTISQWEMKNWVETRRKKKRLENTHMSHLPKGFEMSGGRERIVRLKRGRRGLC